MDRFCELCGVNINHKRLGARYCCRSHKNSHYRHLHRDRYNEHKKRWQRENLDKIAQSRKEKRSKEIKLYGYTKNYLREYAKRHIDELRTIKPEKCFKCGTEEDLVIHHEKYTKNPKDWEFVCNPCHRRLHNPTALV